VLAIYLRLSAVWTPTAPQSTAVSAVSAGRRVRAPDLAGLRTRCRVGGAGHDPYRLRVIIIII
jgi:hypothetical protein